MLGFSLIQATAHSKLLNMTSNLAALLFLIGGYIVWSFGLVVAAGQIIGASFGVHLVIRHGTALIRPLLVIVSIALMVNDPANPIRLLAGF